MGPIGDLRMFIDVDSATDKNEQTWNKIGVFLIGGPLSG